MTRFHLAGSILLGEAPLQDLLSRRIGKRNRNSLGCQLSIELTKLLGENQFCHVLIHIVEHHGVGKTVDELWA